jgi:hypothetical protein
MLTDENESVLRVRDSVPKLRVIYLLLLLLTPVNLGARGSIVGCHYATSRKVAGSSPDEVTGFFS